MSDTQNLTQPLMSPQSTNPTILGSKHRARGRRGRGLSRKLPSKIGRLMLTEKMVPNPVSVSTVEHVRPTPMSRSTQTTEQLASLQNEAASTIQSVTANGARAALLVGDSIVARARDLFGCERSRRLKIDAVGGRTLFGLKRMVQEKAIDVSQFDRIIIYLGTNDLHVRSAMAMIAIVEEIIILLRGVDETIDILFCEIGPRHFRGNRRFPADDDHTVERRLAYNSLLANVWGCGVVKMSYTLSDSIDGLHPGPVGSSTVVHILKSYFH
jgi:hypothetical protein